MKIAIIGAGGVGGYLGAKLAAAGEDITLTARGSHLAALRKNGLTLESVEGNLHVSPPVYSTLPEGKTYDLFVIAVKSFDTAAAGEAIRPVFHPKSVILSIQNGVENEDTFGKMYGDDAVMGGVAWIYSTIGEPGVVRHTGGTGKFVIGEMDGAVSERIRSIESCFAAAGITISTTENIRHLLWEKWAFISAVGGMTAWARKPIGEITSDSSLNEMLEMVVEEALAVAKQVSGLNFDGSRERTFERIRRLPPSGTSSMYYDVTHGKTAEVEALNGAAVRFGRLHGISVPANEKIYRALVAHP
jgi:2-dehydropantoate 2-reductase